MIKIRELSAQDAGTLADFFSSQTGATADSMLSRMRWLARNPAFTPEIPLGVAAFDTDRICGAMLFIPTRFTDGETIRTCILSILFYVDPSVRGAGLPLFLSYRKLAGKYPLYAATANQTSSRLWSSFAGRAIPGSELEYVRVCRPLPVISEFFLRNFPSQSRARSSYVDVALHPSVEEKLVPIPDPDLKLQSLATAAAGSFEALRDPQTIRWKIYERAQTLYLYRNNRSECLCLFQYSRRGSRSQIAAVDLLELWGCLDWPDTRDFLLCVQRLFSADLISFRGGTPLAKMEQLARYFRRRRFGCPAVWLMDPNNLLDNRFRYSPFAGE